MAVYTEVADEDLNAFVAGYDIGAVLSVKGIAEGVENSNFLLVTHHGTFILTLYEKRVAREDLPFFLGLMEHLAARGVNCPVPLKNKQGKALGELSGRPASIVTFLPGVSVRRPRLENCAATGSLLAQVHRAALDFGMRRENALSVKAWRPLFERCGGRADEVQKGLGAEIESELTDLERSWPASLPQGVIHADLFPDNVFFLRDQISGVIDFYFACNDMLAYDVAILINAWCFEVDGSLNITKSRALLTAYRSLRPMTNDEIAALPLLARGAAMRFLLTRLYDWLTVPEDALVVPKDPLEYYKKLRFHRTALDASAYGI
jgi:homoserine kinase type II